MGKSLIIQGIVSKFHFHVNNTNYQLNIWLSEIGGGGNRSGV